MKKIFFLVLLAIIFLPSVMAVNLKIEKLSSNEVMINDLKQPAVFELKMTNLGSSDNFQFYNLLGFSMSPKGSVYIGNGETKNITVIDRKSVV